MIKKLFGRILLTFALLCVATTSHAGVFETLGIYAAGGPTINWDFTKGVLPSSLTFTNASNNRSYFDVTGTMQFASANVPRFDYDPVTHAPLGLLMEEQRQNLLIRSSEIASWTNNGSTSTTDNVYVSPDGTQNASQIVVDATAKGRFKSFTTVAATSYAVSGYVKTFSGGTSIKVGPETTEDVAGNGQIAINTTTGAITASGTKTYDKYSVLLPNGWTYFRYRVVSGASQTSMVYTAYSSSGASTFSVWGLQAETGSFATSYIPTTTAAVTRAADSLVATSIPWFNTAQGTFMVEAILADATGGSSAQTLASFNDGSSTNRFYTKSVNGTGVLRSIESVGGSGTSFNTANAFTSGVSQKAAVAFITGGNVSSVLNGGTVASTTGGGVLPATQLQFFATAGSSEAVHAGYLRAFKYYNRALTNAQLQAITQ